MNDFSDAIANCLYAARLLPPRCRFCKLEAVIGEGYTLKHDDLLPWITDTWRRVAQHCRHHRGSQEYRQRWQTLRACQQGSAKLLLDASFHFGPAFEKWLGWRLAWYPGGIPEGELVGIASSRLGRRLDEKPGWFQKLRHYCQQLDPEKQLFLAVSRTASAPFVVRAAKLLEKPCLQATIIDAKRWKYWGQLFWDTTLHDHDPGCWKSYVSPVVTPRRGPATSSQLVTAPAHDRSLVSASNKIWICQLRKNGILQELVERRLASSWSEPGSIQLHPSQANIDLRTNPNQTFLQNTTSSGLPSMRPKMSSVRHITATNILQQPWKYLSHWTRRQDGPWPDQDQHQWLDQLILEHPDRGRSALASLKRIARQQQLLSSKSSIRGNHQVVCFTATPLLRWSSLRSYRPHRGRWDFEPYGICIKRQWLKKVGARPVIYGDDTDWQQLSRCQQPFFQHRFGRNASTASRWDWAIEQEWRYPHTLSLKHLPRDEAFLFVPTRQEAKLLAAYSRWQVVYLEPAIETSHPNREF
jgi:hypothetical protein